MRATNTAVLVERFLERLRHQRLDTLQRRPKERDLVMSTTTGKVYEVVKVYDGSQTRARIGVVDLESEEHDALTRGECRVLTAHEASLARAYYGGDR